MEAYQYRQRLSLPLDCKLRLTEARITSFVKNTEKPYISFSGGKDSTVLLHIARQVYKTIPAVFVNTGLEYPEIVKYIKTYNNVTILRPKRSFVNVIEEYGYPILSKKIAMGLHRYRETKDPVQKALRLHGGICPSSGKKQYRTIPKKWHYLTESNIKFSEKCCYFLKKAPLKKYGGDAIVGTRAGESNLRKMNYLKKGCNVFSKLGSVSTPLAFWKEEDIDQYIKEQGIQICKIYKTEKRTGCMFCMFGIDKDPNRFQRMKKTHPKQYKFCMETLGAREILQLLFGKAGKKEKQATFDF